MVECTLVVFPHGALQHCLRDGCYAWVSQAYKACCSPARRHGASGALVRLGDDFDSDETDPATAPACANGLDDDGDGTVDYLAGHGDPGCNSAADDSERDPSGARCDNGLDDDGDTLVDFPNDSGCSGPLDDNEDVPPCANGLDDDGDGRTDFITNSNLSDPGCTDAKDDSERGAPPNAPVCDNGLDDDGDGAADYPGDKGCTGPSDASE